jgi:hypothetical protein
MAQNTKTIDKILIKTNLRLKELDKNWSIRISVASISTNLFLRQFNEFKIKLENKKEIDESIRPAYYGGRCEIFGNPYKNCDQILHMDYNNMYAEILKTNFPTGDLYVEKNVKDLSKEGFYFVDVISDLRIPVLPNR